MAAPTLSKPSFTILADRRLGPWRSWYPCLELRSESDAAALACIAARLCAEFGGTVTDRWNGGAGREYCWITAQGSTLCLMRKEGLGIGLTGEGPRDIALLHRIGIAFGAEGRGWRWKVWAALRRLQGG